LGVLPLPWLAFSLLITTIQFLIWNLYPEFLWSVYGLRAVALRLVVQAVAVIFNGADLIMHLATPQSGILGWSIRALTPAFVAYCFITLGVALWALFFRRGNSFIAVSVAFISGVSIPGWFGLISGFTIGPIHEDYFVFGQYLFEIGLFILLGRRAWSAWRARDELRAEFEAASEMQHKMVALPGDIPGFKVDCVYQPAKQVGGDFFRVIPEGGGSVLVVVGDVSGKGLSAAMTVSAVVGALRSIPPVSPAWILNALNSGLVGQIHGGFVTCCVARIGPDGAAAIANAGHLSPYLAGAELSLAAGLPLGLLAGTEYEESHFQLHPGQPLTFLSDGVVEARNKNGELYGFDRTQAISTEPAEKVAQAAQAFGQEDDITVLTLTRTVRLNPALA